MVSEREFTKAAVDEGLTDCVNMEPLLTGEDVMETLQIRPSKLVGVLLERVNIWQAHHLQGDRSEAIEILKYALKSLPAQSVDAYSHQTRKTG